MQYRFVKSIAEIPAHQWNAIAGTEYPFIRHEFLAALEQSRSVAAHTGWLPHHLVLEDHQQLVAVLPLYVKQHSYGEYVFDWQWAEAYQQHGLPYYPKLVSSIPFTPAAGVRLISTLPFHNLLPVVYEALNAASLHMAASGWHVLFPDKEEAEQWQHHGALMRTGCQFHWFNNGYSCFDEFLSRCVSRKRKAIKKEREKIASAGIQIQRLTGKDITPEIWRSFFDFYQSTYWRKSGHRGYLTQAFFQQLAETMPEHLFMAVAFREQQPVAAALSIYTDKVLYGRYWGCNEDVPGLHFELCYYQGIEFCMEQGIQRFDAGAQGEHKIARGFEPVFTYSLHAIHHPLFRQAIAQFVEEETQALARYRQQALLALPFHN